VFGHQLASYQLLSSYMHRLPSGVYYKETRMKYIKSIARTIEEIEVNDDKDSTNFLEYLILQFFLLPTTIYNTFKVLQLMVWSGHLYFLALHLYKRGTSCVTILRHQAFRDRIKSTWVGSGVLVVRSSKWKASYISPTTGREPPSCS